MWLTPASLPDRAAGLRGTGGDGRVEPAEDRAALGRRQQPRGDLGVDRRVEERPGPRDGRAVGRPRRVQSPC
ncbi:MAG: hypothetical protein KDC33_04205, partial [Thermoleophilia bacterium]|nr:hypothetical protein [Thermoleophilia bacterium]